MESHTGDKPIPRMFKPTVDNNSAKPTTARITPINLMIISESDI